MARTPTVESLLDHLFGHAAATPLREELGEWLGASSRYRRFIDDHRDKARKKLRGAVDIGAQLDVRAELWAAYRLLADRRISLGWEAYGSARGGPDFTVSYRSGRTLNLEVTRVRHAEAAVAHGGPMLSKLRQLPTGRPNALLVIVDEGPGLDPAAVARALRARADEKDEPFFVARGFGGTREFYDRFLRLGAVIVRADAPSTGVTLWVNRSARILVPADALRAAAAALGG
jgi:hypothetical protein